MISWGLYAVLISTFVGSIEGGIFLNNYHPMYSPYNSRYSPYPMMHHPHYGHPYMMPHHYNEYGGLHHHNLFMRSVNDQDATGKNLSDGINNQERNNEAIDSGREVRKYDNLNEYAKENYQLMDFLEHQRPRVIVKHNGQTLLDSENCIQGKAEETLPADTNSVTPNSDLKTYPWLLSLSKKPQELIEAGYPPGHFMPLVKIPIPPGGVPAGSLQQSGQNTLPMGYNPLMYPVPPNYPTWQSTPSLESVSLDQGHSPNQPLMPQVHHHHYYHHHGRPGVMTPPVNIPYPDPQQSINPVNENYLNIPQQMPPMVTLPQLESINPLVDQQGANQQLYPVQSQLPITYPPGTIPASPLHPHYGHHPHHLHPPMPQRIGAMPQPMFPPQSPSYQIQTPPGQLPHPPLHQLPPSHHPQEMITNNFHPPCNSLYSKTSQEPTTQGRLFNLISPNRFMDSIDHYMHPYIFG